MSSASAQPGGLRDYGLTSHKLVAIEVGLPCKIASKHDAVGMTAL